MQRRVSKRRELSTAIGLTISGRIDKRHFDHAIRGPDTVAFLEHPRRWVGRPLIVVRDRLQAHRSKEVKGYLTEHRDIVVEWLPSYSPDLNPEEGRHGDVKRGCAMRPRRPWRRSGATRTGASLGCGIAPT